jgi:hypothetical protein
MGERRGCAALGGALPCWIAPAPSRAQGLIFNELRSKTKTFESELGLDPAAYPDWSYDGSSTGQATGDNSDCIIRYAQAASVTHVHSFASVPIGRGRECMQAQGMSLRVS